MIANAGPPIPRFGTQDEMSEEYEWPSRGFLHYFQYPKANIRLSVKIPEKIIPDTTVA
jgi:hypothetical protein